MVPFPPSPGGAHCPRGTTNAPAGSHVPQDKAVTFRQSERQCGYPPPGCSDFHCHGFRLWIKVLNRCSWLCIILVCFAGQSQIWKEESGVLDSGSALQFNLCEALTYVLGWSGSPGRNPI